MKIISCTVYLLPVLWVIFDRFFPHFHLLMCLCACGMLMAMYTNVYEGGGYVSVCINVYKHDVHIHLCA